MNDKRNLEQNVELTPRQKELYLKFARGTIYTCISTVSGAELFIETYIKTEDWGESAMKGSIAFGLLLIILPQAYKFANYLVKKYGF